MLRAELFSIAAFLVVGFPLNQACILLPYRPASSEWPAECTGKTYCHIKPSYYPDDAFETLWDLDSKPYNTVTGIENRDGDDVACSSVQRRYLRHIYLIKDNNDEIRFVMQTEKINFKTFIEECRPPGTVKNAEYLNHHMLARQRVDCVETRLPIGLPVLSLDGTKLDTVAPKYGFPLSCSAKVIKN